ncbi:uncharacterized protein LOC116168443 isoform X2 [Photinus pyralis]|uniref:uncharacterized protein LOC116168443 isoform X2 n=1 Tax=Photinus pyralis TaxID=7054 RepID=UPI001266FD95|nr:uncharacterized protein LOC116168443 isoform X2 [Photinus pyralis]
MNAIIPIICVIYANVFSIDAYLVPGAFGGECYEIIFPVLKNHNLFNYHKLQKMIVDVNNNAQKLWSEVEDDLIDTFDDDVAYWNRMQFILSLYTKKEIPTHLH